MTSAARVFRVSPFRLNTFRRCRRLYKYRYVERLPTAPNAYDTTGSNIHAALRELMLRAPEERTPARAADIVREQWQTNRAGFRGMADEARWRARAIDQAARFAQLPEAEGTPLAVERYLEVDLTPRVRLFGRIDRIDEASNEGLHIIDYKTGRRPDEIDPGQLQLYAMMVHRSEERPVTAATFLYLDDGTSWTAPPSALDHAAAANGVLETVEQIVSEREYEPAVGPYCAFCDFQAICPARKETVGRRLAEA
ncbi:MAG TPA: PD-(D/E)XK nuclease family protein [Dehalococcoidia bacterium]|nr:PD-(D/E)XK nuclease family protein [Dehalococcoidia bacterium]